MKLRLLLMLVGWIVKVIDLTCRYRYFQLEHTQTAKAHHQHGGYILAIWHRHAFLGITSHAQQPIHPLVSHSKDGELVTHVARKFGMQCVRGSSSRGGFKAMREMLTLLKHGDHIAITVDGPRGPALQVKAGIVDLARRSQAAIVPMIAKSADPWILSKTWDQTRIPKPFSTVAVVYGNPILLPREMSVEEQQQACLEVARALQETEAAAEGYLKDKV